MTNKYISISINKQLNVYINKCEELYREHHPELDGVPLSRSKIIYEVLKFYLKNKKYDIVERLNL